MLTDYQRDWLPEEMRPLISLSKDGKVYIVRVEYLVDTVHGLAGEYGKAFYYTKRSKAVDKIEEFLNNVSRDRILYLALDAYIDITRSSDDSIEIIDRRDTL